MHINILFRKALYVFLSLAIIAAPTMQANAASSWGVTSSVSSGSRAIVTASKAGFKSAVNIAPTAGRLGLKLARGANWAALAYTAIQLAPPLADIESFQPDYANNRVKYDTKPSLSMQYTINSPAESFYQNSASAESLCKSFISAVYPSSTFISVDHDYSSFYVCRFNHPTYGRSGQVMTGYNVTTPSKTEYIAIPAAAAQMITNAKNGHGLSQAAIAETAAEMVIAGDFDADLLSGAVPINDSRPLVPAVPISGNGNVTVGDDGLMTGGDVGAAADASMEAADKAKKAAQAAADAATAGADAAREANDNAQDVINSAVDQALKDAAAASAAQAAKAAKDLADVRDAARDAAKDAADKAARDAETAKDVADRELQDLKDKARDAAEEDKAKADEAVKEAEKEATKAKERADEAEKALEKAKAEAAKPFELPAFCSWASVVCEYTEWVKKEYKDTSDWLRKDPADLAPVPVETTDIDIGNWEQKANAGYVSFSGQCPDGVDIPITFMNATTNMTISYAPFCRFASLIKPAVIFGAWISAMMIISGGRSRE